MTLTCPKCGCTSFLVLSRVPIYVIYDTAAMSVRAEQCGPTKDAWRHLRCSNCGRRAVLTASDMDTMPVTWDVSNEFQLYVH